MYIHNVSGPCCIIYKPYKPLMDPKILLRKDFGHNPFVLHPVSSFVILVPNISRYRDSEPDFSWCIQDVLLKKILQPLQWTRNKSLGDLGRVQKDLCYLCRVHVDLESLRSLRNIHFNSISLAFPHVFKLSSHNQNLDFPFIYWLNLIVTPSTHLNHTSPPLWKLTFGPWKSLVL